MPAYARRSAALALLALALLALQVAAARPREDQA